MGRTRTLPAIDQMKVGAAPTVANATDLLEAAEILAMAGKFGVATSIAILAWEESVKARLLMGRVFADAIGGPFGVTDKELMSILSQSHAKRHDMGFVHGLSVTDRAAMHGIGLLAPARRSELESQLQDTKTANVQKQQGMYVDYDEATGTWRTPSGISERASRERIEKVQAFHAETQRQFRDFANL